MSEYTPGPWAYRPDKYDDWGTVKGADGFVICQARDHRYCDGDVLSEHRRNKTDPWEANARLIAAAPKMYEVLKEIASHLDDSYVDGCLERMLGDKARAAILEAIPEAPK